MPLGPRGSPPSSPIPNSYGEGVLSIAARDGNVEIVRCIVDAGDFDVEALSDMLPDAVKGDNLLVTKLLIDAGADARILDNAGRTLLWLVQSFETAEMLLKEAPGLASILSRDGETCLDSFFDRYALGRWTDDEERAPLAALFIENGCDVSSCLEGSVQKALQVAAVHLDTAMVRLILGHRRALVSTRDEDENTLLHLAAFYAIVKKSSTDKLDMIKMLVDFGCDISAVNVGGLTVLHCLFRMNATTQQCPYYIDDYDPGYTSLVRYLLYAGVDISIRSSQHRTAFFDAIYQHNSEVALLLINAGILPLVSTTEILWAFHMVAQDGLAEVLQQLLQTKVDINHRSVSGETVLHEAVRQTLNSFKRIEGLVRMVGCILLGYPDVSVPEVGGERRLKALWADKTGRLEVIRLLCRRGVDASIRNDNGLTAFDFVKAAGPPLPWDSLAKELTKWGHDGEDSGEPLVLNWAAEQEEADLSGIADMLGD